MKRTGLGGFVVLSAILGAADAHAYMVGAQAATDPPPFNDAVEIHNGATRIVPGSHRNPWMMKTRYDPRRPHPAERHLTGPAGTIFILNIHCGHSATHNATKQPRHALFSNFSRRDSPVLMANPLPDPSPVIMTRFVSDVQSLLRS